MTRPIRIIKIYYLKNNVVDFNYSMLLGRPWLKDVKITHDWGNNVITFKVME
jgi:hypothetical protein